VTAGATSLIGVGVLVAAGAALVATAPAARPARAASARVVDCRSELTRRARYRGPRCLPAAGSELVVGGVARRPVWTGRLASTRLAGWSGRQLRPGSLRIVRGPGTGRRHVALFRVRPGDRPVPGGERAEVVADQAATGGQEGTEAWYAWATAFAERLHPLPSDTWNVFTQWHGTAPDHCSPNIALQVNTRPRPARIRLAARGGALRGCTPQTSRTWDTVAVRRRRWYDFALHVRWSSHPARGFVELAIDGRIVVPRTPIATLYRGQGVYLKQGFYRGASPATSRIYHGGVMRFP
jgi:Polysaccharide lyase